MSHLFWIPNRRFERFVSPMRLNCFVFREFSLVGNPCKPILGDRYCRGIQQRGDVTGSVGRHGSYRGDQLLVASGTDAMRLEASLRQQGCLVREFFGSSRCIRKLGSWARHCH